MLRRGDVRVAASADRMVVANDITIEVWDGSGWIAINGVTALHFSIEAGRVGQAEIGLVPRGLNLNIDAHQLVIEQQETP